MRPMNITEALNWALARIEQNASEEPQEQVDACLESIDAAALTAVASPPRRTFWDVSTAHITADDVKLLEADLGPVHYTYEGGFFIPVPGEMAQAAGPSRWHPRNRW